jgi:hypothetical protein
MEFFVVEPADQVTSMEDGVDPPDSGWPIASQMKKGSLMFKGSIVAETPS